MSDFKDITQDFEALYHPKSALVFYQMQGSESNSYVEHFDMDRYGNLINAHPLTIREAQQLSEALNVAQEEGKAFLKPKGIIPTSVLQINPSENGSVLWYTKAQQRQMFFVDNLGIPNGKSQVPAMVWFADKNSLHVYALVGKNRPNKNTALYHAPFFNVYADGDVCMGSVNVQIKKSASLEEFIAAWENYFFNSYFSHLVKEHNPVDGNCVSLWKHLVTTGEAFPSEVLIKNNSTIKTYCHDNR